MVFKDNNKCLKNDTVAEATFDLQFDNVNSIIVFIQIFIKFTNFTAGFPYKTSVK